MAEIPLLDDKESESEEGVDEPIRYVLVHLLWQNYFAIIWRLSSIVTKLLENRGLKGDNFLAAYKSNDLALSKWSSYLILAIVSIF